MPRWRWNGLARIFSTLVRNRRGRDPLAISAAEELARLLPVLEALRGRLKIPISVDTQKSAVAELAIGAGAEILNDISGLKHDARLAEVAARHKVPLILMHMRGTPAQMQKAAIREECAARRG